MLKCPNPECGAQNVDGTLFCEVCGEELHHEADPQATAHTVVCKQCGAANPADNLACEACGAILAGHHAPAPAASSPAVSLGYADSGHPGASGAEVSPFDAALASEPAPPAGSPAAAAPVSSLPDPAVAVTAPLPAGAAGSLFPGTVKLVVEQGQTVGAQFVLGDPEILIGREDEEEEIYPDVDLSEQDGGYVHRRHATLQFADGHLTVTHLGGINKTRVNNRPIPDNQPQPVALGDKIAFGKVVVRVLPA